MRDKKPTVGIVNLQGDFHLHRACIEELGGIAVPVRDPEDLQGVSALIIPGGESTTLSILGWQSGLWKEVMRLASQGLHILGTCAGLIILSKEIEADRLQVTPLKLLDAKVRRNAYGSQVNSFEASLQVKFGNESREVLGVFIRAPVISEVGKGVEVLATLNSSPVFVRQGTIWGLTFHPELSGDTFIHQKFLDLLSG